VADISLLARKRGRLKRAAVYAVVVLISSLAIGFNDSAVERIAPKPDYYRVVMSEVGRGHFESTGTTTIVREDDYTQELFVQQYKQRIGSLGLPVPATITIPENALVQLSYETNRVMPGYRLDELRAELRVQIVHPTIGLNPPSLPLALLVYSRGERVMAFFCYEAPDQDMINNPPPGWHPNRELQDELQPLDTAGLVVAYGSLPSRVLPIHAYLFPFGDLKLENLDRNLSLSPDLTVFDDVLPLFYAVH
jgi:hypothetical protein